jgi:cytochrome P450
MSDSKPRVVFDIHSSEYARNWLAIDRDLRENHPVAWSDAHGGFWILSRYEDVKRAASDWETFSSENDISGTGKGGKGILIPRNTFQFALSESDPPQATTLRKIYTPHFLHSNLERWEGVARAFADEAIDRVIGSGKLDFVRDIGLEVPARTVLKLVGVPAEDWKVFAFSAADMSRLPTTAPDYPHEQIAFIQRLILELVRERRREPGNDLVSALVQGQLNGAPLTDEMALGTVSAAVFAAFDTTATSILNMLLLLDEHPELRSIMLSDPAKMAAAVEETLRLYPPGHSLGRTVAREVSLHGQTLKPSDRALLLWSAANRDPRKFERPDEFQIDRPNVGQHLTFSFGIHRCLGSLLAKMEIRVTLQAILQRIGDYRIDRSGIVRYQAIGHIDGFEAMPASFTPRQNSVAA